MRDRIPRVFVQEGPATGVQSPVPSVPVQNSFTIVLEDRETERMETTAINPEKNIMRNTSKKNEKTDERQEYRARRRQREHWAESIRLLIVIERRLTGRRESEPVAGIQVAVPRCNYATSNLVVVGKNSQRRKKTKSRMRKIGRLAITSAVAQFKSPPRSNGKVAQNFNVDYEMQPNKFEQLFSVRCES
ncbi:hypothetical protein K438DRAFT_1762930 [Mycena galopus ATCC 62051]|nr:hypothetical protein K438DRAFT_1762930 [Mycena galopus ATCC 62051]